MGKMKDLRLFIAEDIVARSNGLIDLDRGFVLADELWDEACKKNKRATVKLGRFVKRFKKEKEQV